MSATRTVDESYANGYGNSKWAGEVLLREAHDLAGLPVSVFRCDMIMADTTYAGQLSVPDMFTRMMLSLVATGVAPSSFYELDEGGSRQRSHFDGLPVEFIADAISTMEPLGLLSPLVEVLTSERIRLEVGTFALSSQRDQLLCSLKRHSKHLTDIAYGNSMRCEVAGQFPRLRLGCIRVALSQQTVTEHLVGAARHVDTVDRDSDVHRDFRGRFISDCANEVVRLASDLGEPARLSDVADVDRTVGHHVLVQFGHRDHPPLVVAGDVDLVGVHVSPPWSCSWSRSGRSRYRPDGERGG